jgi:hypothetical protein
MTDWDVDDLCEFFERAGLTVAMEVANTISPLQLSSATIDRWIDRDLSITIGASQILIIQWVRFNYWAR